MNSTNSIVYLIPAFLDDQNTQVIPAYVLESIKKCQVFLLRMREVQEDI